MLRNTMRSLLRLAASALLGMLVLAVALYARFLLSGPPPEAWHTAALAREFTADRAAEVKDLDGYRRLEDRLFEELRLEVYAKVAPGNIAPFNRYAIGSLSDPGTWPINWNRTYEITPPRPVGGVLLLHGLTDSPYSLRSIGEHLGARGFRVVGLRLPGHGTAPAGLLHFRVEDLAAATRLAMQDLRTKLGPDLPIYIVGYSNGAALAVDYTAGVLAGEPGPKPAGLVLISPALGISKLAIVARIRTGLSSVPGFGRAAWQVITPEVDPYKYQSFPFHAAGETQRLTSRVARRIGALARDGVVPGFPPVLAFVSTVDSTVHAQAVVDVLLDRIAAPRDELVLFDVNRLALVQPLLEADPGPPTQKLLAMPNRPFALTVISNADPQTRQVEELRSEAGSRDQTKRLLDLYWPPNVFSLSHVALPFPPDDPLYGYDAPPDAKHVQLGRIAAKGEIGVLRIPTWMLTRQRSNPFHPYLLQRIDAFVGAAAPAS